MPRPTKAERIANYSALDGIRKAEVRERRRRFLETLRGDTELINALAIARGAKDLNTHEIDLSKTEQFVQHGYEVSDATVQQG
jgi:hypothetical protein